MEELINLSKINYEEESKTDVERETSSDSSKNPNKVSKFNHNAFKELGENIEKFILTQDFEKKHFEEQKNYLQELESTQEKNITYYLSLLNVINNLYSESICNEEYNSLKNSFLNKKKSIFLEFLGFLIDEKIDKNEISKQFELFFKLFPSKELIDENDIDYFVSGLKKRALFFLSTDRILKAKEDLEKVLQIVPDDNFARDKIDEINNPAKSFSNSSISISKKKLYTFEYINNLNEEGKAICNNDWKKAQQIFSKGVSFLEFYHSDELEKKNNFYELYSKMTSNNIFALITLSDFEKALNLSNKFVEKQPDYYKAFYLRGIVFEKLAESKENQGEKEDKIFNLYQNAMNDFKKASELEKKPETWEKFQNSVKKMVVLKKLGIERDINEFERECRNLEYQNDKLFRYLEVFIFLFAKS